MGLHDLGLSEEVFLGLTWKELDALCKRKKLNDRRVEGYSARIACLLYNIHRGDQKALQPEDFMSEPSSQKKSRVVQTADQMKSIAKMITAAFNGEIK